MLLKLYLHGLLHVDIKLSLLPLLELLVDRLSPIPLIDEAVLDDHADLAL